MTRIVSLSAATAGLLVLGALSAPGVAFASPVQSSAPSSLSVKNQPDLIDADTAKTADLASEIAVEFDHEVEITSETTATSLVSALPDGQMRLESSSAAVRMQTDDGWVDIDPSLEESSNGAWVPVATEVPIEFSPGGDGPLARVQTDSGDWVSEYWPLGDLPKPSVTGPVATYEDVLDDVDLVLTASPTGFTEVLVIGTAEAAALPELQTLNLSIEGATLSKQSNGTVEAETDRKEDVVSSAAPLWWDSSHPEAGIDGPGGNGIPVELDYTVDDDDLLLNVDSATSNVGLTYPLFIDPDWVLDDQHYWYVDRAYPNQSYLDGANASGSMRLGYLSASAASNADGRTHLARMFWKMDTEKIAGTHVTEAEFRVNEVWSYSCTKSTVELWRVGEVDAGSSWNDTSSGIWLDEIDARYVANGYSSSCPDDVVVFNALDSAQYAAEHDAPFTRLGMRASDEDANVSWKRFSESATLSVTYNHYPAKPAAPTLSYPARVCGTSAAPAVVNGTQNLYFQSSTSDVDTGQTFHTNFHFYEGASTTQVKLIQSAYGAEGPTQATLFANDTLLNGHTYRYIAASSDGVDFSPISDPCYITIDNSSPGLPTISMPATAKTIGKPVNVVFGSLAADKVALFAYWWSYAGSTSGGTAAPVLGATTVTPPVNGQVTGQVRVVAAAANGTATVSTAPLDTTTTLWVASYDAAGNVSKAGSPVVSTTGATVNAIPDPAVTYSAGHGWIPRNAGSPLPSSIPDENISTGTGYSSSTPLALGAGIALDSTSPVGAEPFPTAVTAFPATGAATTSHAAVDVGDSFTASAWIKAGTTAASTEYVAVSQAGSSKSGFTLKVGTTGKLEFCVRWDTTAAGQQCAVGPVAQSGSWVLATGIWDSTNKQVRIAIDNSSTAVGVRTLTASEAAGAAATDASDNGVVVVGSEKSGSSFVNKWNGQVSDVAVFPGVISGGQLTNVFSHIAPIG